MKKTLESFRLRQKNTLNTLENLRLFLEEGKSYGIPIDANIETKLREAMQSVKDNKLHIALVGGFSEGKTSIAAAWLEKLDKSSMKISHEESSNEIKKYEAGSDCILIDTPGLFGFKEQRDASGNMEKYKELTERHISEAHLLLYVMDPINPIKESHREELHWIFRTLKLLPRTVFVLSRFDEVADIEDEQDYAHHFAIKKANVVDRLSEMLSLNGQEVNELSVVAVAADPFGEGTDYWLAHLENFRKLSHIGQLQEATSKKVTASGGIEKIADEARRSIVNDVLHTQLPIALQVFENIDREFDKLHRLQNEQNLELQAVSSRLSDTRASLRNFVSDLFSDLILQAKGLSMPTFSDFFEHNVGSEGIVLETKIKNAFESHLGSIQMDIQKISVSFDAEINHFNELFTGLAKQGVNYFSRTPISKEMVLASRDGIVNAAKFVGLDIGKHLKFKPWGAAKFAKGAGAFLAVFGLALEILDSYKKAEAEKKFQEAIKAMVENFEQQRKELLAFIDSPSFDQQCLPALAQLREAINQLAQELQAKEEKRGQFEKWRKHGEIIEGEFCRLAA